MKTLPFALVVLLTVAAAPAAAQPYVGGQITWSNSDCEGFEQGVAPVGLSADCDVWDAGYRVNAGLHLGEVLGVEVGYLDSGEGVARALAPDGSEQFTLTAPFKAFDAVLTLRREWDSGWRVVARGGVARWDYEVIPSVVIPGFGADNEGTTPTFGVAVEYRWLTLGYDAILNVGQENVLDPSLPDIEQTIQRLSAGVKLLF